VLHRKKFFENNILPTSISNIKERLKSVESESFKTVIFKRRKDGRRKKWRKSLIFSEKIISGLFYTDIFTSTWNLQHLTDNFNNPQNS